MLLAAWSHVTICLLPPYLFYFLAAQQASSSERDPAKFLNISEFLFFICFLNTNVKEKAKPRKILKTTIFYVKKCLITAFKIFTTSFIFEDNSKICHFLRNLAEFYKYKFNVQISEIFKLYKNKFLKVLEKQLRHLFLERPPF